MWFALAMFALLSCAGAPPGVERVSPPGGQVGQTVTITGNGFDEGMAVSLGGLPLEDVVVEGGRTIRGRVPAGLGTGEHDLLLTNPDGGRARIPRAFAVAGL